MPTNPSCPTYLLDDLPSEEDLLGHGAETGSHERIAEALGELLSSANESGGKMIGIEGSWGSGKSTVVRLVAEKLKSIPDVSFMSFDTWAHEGDPLRRTFLESLIVHLQEEGWVDHQKWDEEREYLTHRVVNSKIKTVSTVTCLGKLFSVAVLFVPVGAVFLNAGLARGITLSNTGTPAWTFVVGLVLSLLWGVVLFGNWIRLLKKKPRDREDWAFVASEGSKEIHQQSISTKDPTSIEFDRIFGRLMLDAIGNRQRKIVLVLDNLDRVDAADARAVWATLQTFLQDRSMQQQSWHERVWVVVPYDARGLEGLWLKPDEAGGQVQKISESFLDKSFHLRFYVPPLLLHDWQQFLDELIKQALPNHSVQDRASIQRTLDACHQGVPTPRELKTYVNQIGAVHRQWGHEFRMSHVAAYVHLVRSGESLRQDLIDGKAPSPTLIAVVEGDLRQSLAALLHNVDSARGSELLLSQPIREALKEGNHKRLTQLASVHGAAYWSVQDQVLRDLGNLDEATIARIGKCLDESELLGGAKETDLIGVQRSLVRLGKSIGTWSNFSPSSIRGLRALCTIADDSGLAESVVAGIRLGLASQESFPLGSIAALMELAESVDALLSRELGLEPFKLPGDGTAWIKCCGTLFDLPEPLRHYARPNESLDIGSTLANLVTSGSVDKGVLKALKHSMSLGLIEDELAMADACQARLSMDEILDPSEVADLIDFLQNVDRHGKLLAAAETRRELSTDGTIAHWYQLADEADDLRCKVSCLAELLIQVPSLEITTTTGRSADGVDTLTDELSTGSSELAQRLAEEFQRLSETDALVKAIGFQGSSSLLLRCLDSVIESGSNRGTLADNEMIVQHHEVLRRALSLEGGDTSPDRWKRLVESHCRILHLITHLIAAGFDIGLAELYCDVWPHGQQGKFRDFIASGLKSLDQDDWSAVLTAGGPPMQLISAYYRDDATLDIVALETALGDYGKDVLTANVELDTTTAETLPVLLSAIGSDVARKRLGVRLLNEVARRNGECSDSFLDNFGAVISATSVLAGSPDVYATVLHSLVTIGGAGEIRLLEEMIKGNVEHLPQNAEMDDLRKRVADALKAEKPEQVRETLTRVAGLLGIKESDQTQSRSEPEILD